MRKNLTLLALSLGIAFINPLSSVVAQAPNSQPVTIPVTPEIPPVVVPALEPINLETVCTPQNCLGLDEQLWGKQGDKQALLTSIDNSLRYLATNKAVTAYQNYPIKEITLNRVQRSLVRFRQLVVSSQSAAELQAAVRREFVFYQSVGNDGKGTVKFTAYYEPVYVASRVRTAVYKYPLYSLPPDFQKWPKPHPKRIDLEGKDGLLGDKSKLRGLEIVWFSNRLDPYMVQIQGSAQIKLTNGQRTSVGYAGGTDYAWTSIGKELAKDGKLPLSGLTMPKLITYFRQNPKELSNYLPRWERFVFFAETNGTPATGSIVVPVTAERSIATDKSLMPPGALALIINSFPYPTNGGKLESRLVNRFVLDQDTGSAIKGPGRVDYFMGSGQLAGDRAGISGGNGSLFYLLLKE
ncbi:MULTISPECIES: murein transglycosylase A [Aphanizomenon]|uniref:murein transglycosylase A n=1 Tax=Aphanizomenon TaxID=1175 RepID=UPI000543D639|nr:MULTISPECIES: murein transglycosylase A [Aphanizomenon]KHG41797.1 murein transglycosylase [Aphanizomenon flos-aquae 2012/KM1/D3]MTJ28628.1 murein transglycosylase [Aphanizomenon sp. UHCC 0183]QSV73728.1 MAG: murein transglycosylase A [Aphanizomenon flos-aquae KM1D3_PB]